MVFTGLPSGDLVLPVRLAQGAGQWTHLCHFLADPTVWHKIDLVRVRDRRAPGGWRFYAHLLVHQAGYQAPSTQARRTQIPTDRRAGVDANVSNLALASFPADRPEQLLIDQITCTAEQQLTAHKAARKARARQRALDRSRRNTNSDQYGPSPRQQTRAARRAAAGLSPKRVLNPGGPRHARADGVPLRGYRHDCLSRRYNRVRADHAAESGRASQAKQARAQQMAARIVAAHGNVITVEDCRISTWARLWGTRIALFSPGMLVAALKRECAATGGQLYRAGTHFTALSQHCLCGARVPKSLSQRTHACPHCGLHGDRDVISAILAACVDIADPDDPRTARVDYRLAHALRRGWPPSKSGRAQSTGTSHQQYPLPDRPGPAATTRWPLLSTIFPSPSSRFLPTLFAHSPMFVVRRWGVVSPHRDLARSRLGTPLPFVRPRRSPCCRGTRPFLACRRRCPSRNLCRRARHAQNAFFRPPSSRASSRVPASAVVRGGRCAPTRCLMPCRPVAPRRSRCPRARRRWNQECCARHRASTIQALVAATVLTCCACENNSTPRHVETLPTSCSPASSHLCLNPQHTAAQYPVVDYTSTRRTIPAISLLTHSNPTNQCTELASTYAQLGKSELFTTQIP